MAQLNKITFTYLEFGNDDQLDPPDLELLRKARDVAASAYAPYSHFKVGAAVRLESGVIITGTNVENAAFSSGICAERNALSTASSNYPADKPVAIAITAFTEAGMTDEPVSPCGNCRQVIAEEEYRNCRKIRIIMGGRRRTRIVEKGEDLLPMQFSKDNMLISPR